MSLLMDSRQNWSSSTTETRKAFGIRTPAVRSTGRLQHVVAPERERPKMRQRRHLGNAGRGKSWLIPRADFFGRAQRMTPGNVDAPTLWSRPRAPLATNRAVQVHGLGITWRRPNL